MTLGSVKSLLHREVCMYRSQEFQDPLAVYCSRDTKTDAFSFSVSIYGSKPYGGLQSTEVVHGVSRLPAAGPFPWHTQQSSWHSQGFPIPWEATAV